MWVCDTVDKTLMNYRHKIQSAGIFFKSDLSMKELRITVPYERKDANFDYMFSQDGI